MDSILLMTSVKSKRLQNVQQIPSVENTKSSTALYAIRSTCHLELSSYSKLAGALSILDRKLWMVAIDEYCDISVLILSHKINELFIALKKEVSLVHYSNTTLHQ